MFSSFLAFSRAANYFASWHPLWSKSCSWCQNEDSVETCRARPKMVSLSKATHKKHCLWLSYLLSIGCYLSQRFPPIFFGPSILTNVHLLNPISLENQHHQHQGVSLQPMPWCCGPWTARHRPLRSLSRSLRMQQEVDAISRAPPGGVWGCWWKAPTHWAKMISQRRNWNESNMIESLKFIEFKQYWEIITQTSGCDWAPDASQVPIALQTSCSSSFWQLQT